MTGWQMLFYKEVLRFWKVGIQTIAAPVITAAPPAAAAGRAWQRQCGGDGG